MNTHRGYQFDSFILVTVTAGKEVMAHNALKQQLDSQRGPQGGGNYWYAFG